MDEVTHSHVKEEKGTHLASINFTQELLDWLDEMAPQLGMSRSALVCHILKFYKDSNKRPRFVMG